MVSLAPQGASGTPVDGVWHVAHQPLAKRTHLPLGQVVTLNPDADGEKRIQTCVAWKEFRGVANMEIVI